MSLLELINKITLELSGEKAKRTTSFLSLYHRIQASKEFHTALEFLSNELKKLGDENYQIHEYIADGTKLYSEWETPISWDIEDGSLQLLEPTKKALCRFSEVPESICTHSKSADFTAEVVHVGAGKEEDFEKADVNGKVVLTTASPRTLIERLAKHGALGVVAYPSEQRAQGYQEMIQYVGLWPNAENVEQSTFGFSLSRKQALELINYMKEGKKVKIKGEIRAELYEGKMHVLSTKIEGNKHPEEEIIIIAHICHPAPSANDNASGSSLLLEIYRTIKKLIQNGEIDYPERSIRFLWVPEFSGTIPWIMEKKEEDNFKPILCINLDMVGEHPSLVGYPFTFNKESISTPSFLNDLISECIDNVKDNPLAIEQGGWQFPWNFRIKPFAGGSDQLLFNDAPLRIPSVMFGHPDTFHHTNLDTIEKVDPTTLKRVGSVAVSTVLSCCYEEKFSTEIQRIFLKGLVKRKGLFLNMITRELESLTHLKSNERNEKEYLIRNLLHSYRIFERKGIQSIDNLFTNLNTEVDELLKNELKVLENSFNALVKDLTEEIKDENTKQLIDKIPKRMWEGPFSGKKVYKAMSDLDQLAEEQNFSEEQLTKIKRLSQIMSSDYGGMMLDTINLINNQNNILEITSNLSLVDWKIIDLGVIDSFMKLLKNLEIINY